MSEYEVVIFHRTGEPKESSFPTSRKPSVHDLWQQNETFRKRKLNVKKRATRKKDAIPSQKSFHSTLHLFKPDKWRNHFRASQAQLHPSQQVTMQTG